MQHSINLQPRNRVPRIIAALAMTLVWATFAHAWKPKTHIYLADVALKEVSNGKLPFYLVNHDTGEVLSKIGDYEVDSDLVNGIKANRGIFNAGVLGPDAYPDIVTGQCIIHPQNSFDEGSNSWLEHLWTRSRNSDMKVKAFVTGYLFHAAGDMYMHTYVNNYAGGEFKMGTNALRHLVLEGYYGKLTPLIDAKDFSISNGRNDTVVSDWIYDNMIKASLGSKLENKLLVVGSGQDTDTANLSVPRIYSRLRNYLSQRLDEMNLTRANNDPLNGIKKLYVKAWIEDIDDGLKAWPAFSEKVARLLVYDAGQELSTGDMKERLAAVCQDFLNQHLLSMSGAPDFVGATRAQIQEIVEALLGPFEDYVNELKENFETTLVKAVTGMTPDQIADYIKRPENYFDQVLGPGSSRDPGAQTITKAEVDNLLKMQNGQWKIESFAPAYNTVQMTKLILLKKSEVNRLIADLKGATLQVPKSVLDRGLTIRLPNGIAPATVFVNEMDADNAMLGFNFMLDGSNQWRLHGRPNQMVMVMAGVYNKMFVKEVGESYELEPAPAPKLTGTIKVTVTKVEAIDDVDPAPGQGQADFYARIEVDDKFKSFDTINNDSNISPNWTVSNSVVGEKVTIRIYLYDEDGGLGGADDKCDISPSPDRKHLTIKYNLRTGKITGDATGDKGDTITTAGQGSDRCRIKFKVEQS